MEICTVHLYQAGDAESSFALKLPNDPPDQWRAQSGFGKSFQKIWNIELQSHGQPQLRQVNWDAVLERILEAYNLSDPIITNFEWPKSTAA